jgi:hypothetical protein
VAEVGKINIRTCGVGKYTIKRLEMGSGAKDQRNKPDEMLLYLFKSLANIASKELHDEVNLPLHKYRKPATSIPCIQDHPACITLTLQFNTKLTKLASPKTRTRNSPRLHRLSRFASWRKTPQAQDACFPFAKPTPSASPHSLIPYLPSRDTSRRLLARRQIRTPRPIRNSRVPRLNAHLGAGRETSVRDRRVK